MAGNRHQTTEELVEELKAFNHTAAAYRLARLKEILDRLGLCEYCGRDNCERTRT